VSDWVSPFRKRFDRCRLPSSFTTCSRSLTRWTLSPCGPGLHDTSATNREAQGSRAPASGEPPASAGQDRARLEDVIAGSTLVSPVRRLAPDRLQAWARVIARRYSLIEERRRRRPSYSAREIRSTSFAQAAKQRR
jgi:hypothetical protein